MVGPSVLLAAAILQPMSDRSAAKALAKAEPVATCTVGADCDAKWKRAREWVVANSRFALAVDSSDAILTYPALYANTDSSFAVALDAPVNGARTIRFRAWCGNFLSCIPKSASLRLQFVSAMQ